MGSGGIIRAARTADLDELERLENTAFTGDRLSRRSLRYYVGSRTVDFLVLELAGTVAADAIVAYRRAGSIARLYTLAVRGDMTGKGLGRQLLAGCEAAARVRRQTRLRLEVRDDNTAAIRLYERAGYRRFGTYDDYYEDGSSAIRFERDLG